MCSVPIPTWFVADCRFGGFAEARSTTIPAKLHQSGDSNYELRVAAATWEVFFRL